MLMLTLVSSVTEIAPSVSSSESSSSDPLSVCLNSIPDLVRPKDDELPLSEPKGDRSWPRRVQHHIPSGMDAYTHARIVRNRYYTIHLVPCGFCFRSLLESRP